MFISPQHSGTTSSSGASIISAVGTSGCSSASGGHHHHHQYQQQPQKKRKLEHGHVEYLSTTTAAVADTTSGSGSGLVYGQSASVLHHHHRSSRSHHIKHSPNGAAALLPQNFIRASTIKLLDTYQRCGQKVRIFSAFLLLMFIIAKFKQKVILVQDACRESKYLLKNKYLYCKV